MTTSVTPAEMILQSQTRVESLFLIRTCTWSGINTLRKQVVWDSYGSKSEDFVSPERIQVGADFCLRSDVQGIGHLAAFAEALYRSMRDVRISEQVHQKDSPIPLPGSDCASKPF